MAIGTPDLTTEISKTPKAPSSRKAPAKNPATRRRRGPRVGESPGARFFLVKTSSNGSLELEQELASENEAIVESFRGGSSFAVVTEWKPIADLSNGSPVIKKEAIVSEKRISHS